MSEFASLWAKPTPTASYANATDQDRHHLCVLELFSEPGVVPWSAAKNIRTASTPMNRQEGEGDSPEQLRFLVPVLHYRLNPAYIVFPAQTQNANAVSTFSHPDPEPLLPAPVSATPTTERHPIPTQTPAATAPAIAPSDNRTETEKLNGAPAAPEIATPTDPNFATPKNIPLQEVVGHLLSCGLVDVAERVCTFYRIESRDLDLVKAAHALAHLPTLYCRLSKSIWAVLSEHSPPTTTVETKDDGEVELPDISKTELLARMASSCAYAGETVMQLQVAVRVASVLDESLRQIQQRDPYTVLRELLGDGGQGDGERFSLCQAFIGHWGLGAQRVAAVMTDVFIENARTHPWSTSHCAAYVRLCPGTPVPLGHRLLQTLETRLILLAPTLQAELLILAFAAYDAANCISGIDTVVDVIRERGAQWKGDNRHALLLRLFTGIKAYGRLGFVLDTLLEDKRFDLVVESRGLEAGEGEGEDGLKIALKEYLRGRLGGGAEVEHFIGVYSRFNMHRDHGSLLEALARNRLAQVQRMLSEGLPVDELLEESEPVAALEDETNLAGEEESKVEDASGVTAEKDSGDEGANHHQSLERVSETDAEQETRDDSPSLEQPKSEEGESEVPVPNQAEIVIENGHIETAVEDNEEQSSTRPSLSDTDANALQTVEPATPNTTPTPPEDDVPNLDMTTIANQGDAQHRTSLSTLLCQATSLLYRAALHYQQANCPQMQQHALANAMLALQQLRRMPPHAGGAPAGAKVVLGLKELELRLEMAYCEDLWESYWLASCYGSNVTWEWVSPIYQQAVVRGDLKFFQHFQTLCPCPAHLLVALCETFKADPLRNRRRKPFVKLLVTFPTTRRLQMSLASELGFDNVARKLLIELDGVYQQQATDTKDASRILN
eukprot:c19575_g1_i1.p1 GENE.c19575_g1_i1~~c19575_g1_i1.p1  ORF type:complete len:952 (+),score=197.70 c19575_g1_i1:170-2857(+)